MSSLLEGWAGKEPPPNGAGFLALRRGGLAREKLWDKELAEGEEPGSNLLSFKIDGLTIGFDAPTFNMILISCPVLSQVLYMQMVGRGLRSPSNSPDSD
jgi:hypothetical protein